MQYRKKKPVFVLRNLLNIALMSVDRRQNFQ
jgi:hypothetical protein